MNNQQFNSTDSKFAAWIKFQEDNKNAYPEDDEKVRRGKLSIDYQLIKFYNAYERSSIESLISDFGWRHYLGQYFYHKSLSNMYPQERLLAIAKAYLVTQEQEFAGKLKQAPLPSEFASFIKK